MEKTKSTKEKTGKLKETGKIVKAVKDGKESPEKKLDNTKAGHDKTVNDKASNDKTKKVEKIIRESFPKNINEYRHIIDTFKVTDKDLEWVLELRSHKPAAYPGDKTTLTGQSPNFSSEIDYNYVKKENWDSTYRGLSTDLEHLMRKRIGEQGNQSQLEFEATLRENHDVSKASSKGPRWQCTKKLPMNHIENFLPPLTNSARKNLLKNESYIARPVEIEINKKDKMYIKSIDVNKKNTLVKEWDHLAMEPYSWKYHVNNMNNFRHVLTQTSNNSSSKWTVELRDSYNNPNVRKMSVSEIKAQRNNIKHKEMKRPTLN